MTTTPAMKPYKASQIPKQPTNQFWQKETKKSEQSSRSFFEFWTNLNTLPSAANDSAAAAAGVEIGHPYRNGSVMMVRVT